MVAPFLLAPFGFLPGGFLNYNGHCPLCKTQANALLLIPP